MKSSKRLPLFVALLCVALGAPLQAREQPASPLGVFDISDAQLDPAFWIRLLPDADAPTGADEPQSADEPAIIVG